MDECSMTVVIQIDWSRVLTALSMTRITSLTKILLPHFVTNIAFASSLNSHLEKETDRFHQQKIFPLERNGSVRGVKDTPVADCSAPGVNSTRRVPYCPLIAVSLFLLIVSVTYFKRSLWRCGQL
jgi:hypothetical protein